MIINAHEIDELQKKHAWIYPLNKRSGNIDLVKYDRFSKKEKKKAEEITLASEIKRLIQKQHSLKKGIDSLEIQIIYYNKRMKRNMTLQKKHFHGHFISFKKRKRKNSTARTHGRRKKRKRIALVYFQCPSERGDSWAGWAWRRLFVRLTSWIGETSAVCPHLSVFDSSLHIGGFPGAAWTMKVPMLWCRGSSGGGPSSTCF